MDEFRWDWDAQEVRNADRSLWLRRATRREDAQGYGARDESYGIFEPGYSIGFSATHRLDGSTQNPDNLPGGWEREPDGTPITQICRLSKMVQFKVMVERREELGPFRPTHDRFRDLEQQDRFIAALPEMLKVLPGSFNTKALNQERAGGRIGYAMRLTDEFSTKLLNGALIA